MIVGIVVVVVMRFAAERTEEVSTRHGEEVKNICEARRECGRRQRKGQQHSNWSLAWSSHDVWCDEWSVLPHGPRSSCGRGDDEDKLNAPPRSLSATPSQLACPTRESTGRHPVLPASDCAHLAGCAHQLAFAVAVLMEKIVTRFSELTYAPATVAANLLLCAN